jgi:alpha-glucosidase
MIHPHFIVTDCLDDQSALFTPRNDRVYWARYRKPTTTYYGDEIGLAQVPIPPDRIRDPLERRVPGANLGRDGARTPMQWSTKSYAGFSNSEPWLPLTTDWPARNVEILREDSRSIYGLCRRLIETRGGSEALKRGSYHPIAAKGDMLIYVRVFDTERILIVLNLGATPVVSALNAPKGIVLVSTSGKHEGDFIELDLQLDANEGLASSLRQMSIFLLLNLEPGFHMAATATT